MYQIPPPPINYMESEFHTHEQQLHISMLLLMQDITRFRQLAAAQAFLCDEAPLSGKDVVECVDRPLHENGMSLLVLK
jgi:hypothetical protein